MTDEGSIPATGGWSRAQRLCLWGIVLTALAVRGLNVTMHGIAVDDDTAAFLAQARSLLDGDVYGWFAVHTKPPLYSALVAVPAAAGFSLVASARLVSLLAGLLLLHPAWLILRRCGDRWTALLALALVAVMKVEVMLSGRCISDTVYGVLTLYALYFFLARGLLDGRVRAFAAAGGLVGLAYLCRTEGLTFVPLLALIGLVGCLRKKLPARTGAAGLAVFLAVSLGLLAAHVGTVSFEEGRFTIRRNMGHFMLRSAGLAESGARAADAPGAVETFLDNPGALPASWVRHLWRYLHNEALRATGYVGPALLLIGLWADRRSLLRWALWPLGLLVFLGVLAVLCLIEPHVRFLIGVIVLTAWPTARGAEEIARGLIRANPLRLRRTAWVRPAAAGIVIAGMAAPSVVSSLELDRYEDRDLPVAAEVVRRRAEGGEPPRIAATHPILAFYAGGEIVRLDSEWRLSAEELRKRLADGRADFLVLSRTALADMCPEAAPENPPKFLALVGTARSDPRAKRPREMLVFRVVGADPQ